MLLKALIGVNMTVGGEILIKKQMCKRWLPPQHILISIDFNHMSLNFTPWTPRDQSYLCKNCHPWIRPQYNMRPLNFPFWQRSMELFKMFQLTSPCAVLTTVAAEIRTKLEGHVAERPRVVWLPGIGCTQQKKNPASAWNRPQERKATEDESNDETVARPELDSRRILFHHLTVAIIIFSRNVNKM